MNSKLLTLSMLLMSVVLLGSCVSNKKFAALEDENAQLKTDLAQIQSQVKELQEQNTTLTEDNAEMSSEMSTMEQDLSSTKARVSQVEKEAAMKGQQLDALTAAVDEAFAGLDQTDARVKDIEGVLYLDLDESVNFRTASAAISSGDEEAIDRMAQLLKDHPNMQLLIEGNTDKRSISNDKYGDNWDLSAARSIAVVRKLIDKGVDPSQLTAGGRAEYNPATEDDSAEGLAQNRRIELMVIPKVGTLYKVSQEQK